MKSDTTISTGSSTGKQWEGPFRELFGDERVDYAEALKAHYEAGPPADWDMSYVSAYATTHPWEDWAETWAHYLHIVDTIDTAAACGLELKPDDDNEPTLTDSSPIESESFDNLMKRWFPLTYALNSLNRSLGSRGCLPVHAGAQGDREAALRAQGDRKRGVVFQRTDAQADLRVRPAGHGASRCSG